MIRSIDEKTVSRLNGSIMTYINLLMTDRVGVADFQRLLKAPLDISVATIRSLTAILLSKKYGPNLKIKMK